VDTETRAKIVEETGKVFGDLIKVIALRPKRAKSPETPLSEMAKTAPKTEDVGKMSHEPAKPSKIEDISVACVPCAIGHFSTTAGLLNEAMRFKKEGISSNEILDRIGKALEEQNALERVDLTPENIQTTKEWERPIAEEALEESRALRHKLESIENIEDLEQAAADTGKYYKKLNREWYKGRFAHLGEAKAGIVADLALKTKGAGK